jgi:hypothetical protein
MTEEKYFNEIVAYHGQTILGKDRQIDVMTSVLRAISWPVWTH